MSLFILLPSFFARGFTTSRIVMKDRFLSLDLGFLNLRVFQGATWDPSFGYSIVCWPGTSKIILIFLLSDNARLK